MSSNDHNKLEKSDSVFRELAGAQIKLSTLLDFPDYARRFVEILKSPVGFFRTFSGAGKSEFKSGITFMLQGITVSFVIFTMGWALPRTIANFVATNVTLISGSQAGLATYIQRVQDINRTLPPDLAKAWREQGELMLVTRAVSADGFNALRQRIGALAQEDPELLKLAIDGSLTHGDRFGGRGYLLTFFSALDPVKGKLLHQTYQLVYAGPQYQLQPHLDFLLRTVLFWYLTCFAAARVLRISQVARDDKTVFEVGAYLLGFLNPLFQAFDALVHFYLAATLPLYVSKASDLMTGAGGIELMQLSGGVFPYENLILGTVRIVAWLVFAAVAATLLATGIQSAYRIGKAKALAIGSLGLAIGLGATEVLTGLVVLILAPTGLL
jgi:hypothetical protein